ncbi:hypothetical protein ACPA0F_18135 [Solibacillus silvestris]
MWFEGSVLMKDFPLRLSQLMQTVPPGESEPMWRMVSTNIGSSLTDDGYVLHSLGTSGKDSIFIGVKNALTLGNWSRGHRFFIAENYTPGTATGVNGTFQNVVFNGQRYHWDDNWGGSTIDTLVLNYSISITKDRVIFVTSNNVALSRTESVRAFTYLGLMKRYSEELDSTASVIATNYDVNYNNYGSIRALRNKQLHAGPGYTPKYQRFLQDYGLKGWGNRFLATHIPLHLPTEGYRGELDGILVASYSNDAAGQGRTLPEHGSVTINGKEYLCVYKSYYHGSMHNNFDSNTTSNVYLIEKK